MDIEASITKSIEACDKVITLTTTIETLLDTVPMMTQTFSTDTQEWNQVLWRHVHELYGVNQQLTAFVTEQYQSYCQLSVGIIEKDRHIVAMQRQLTEMEDQATEFRKRVIEAEEKAATMQQRVAEAEEQVQEAKKSIVRLLGAAPQIVHRRAKSVDFEVHESGERYADRRAGTEGRQLSLKEMCI